MSIKRTSSGRQPARGLGSDPAKSSTKVDRQALFEELQRRGQTGEPFGSADVAAALGITETLAARNLLLLSADGFLERVEGGKYLAAPMRSVSMAQFLKELAAAAKNPQREKDLQDIARLRSNNDILREKLRAVTAERDRYLAILREHGIEPGEAPRAVPAAVTAEAPTVPITVGTAAVSRGEAASQGDAQAGDGGVPAWESGEAATGGAHEAEPSATAEDRSGGGSTEPQA